MIDMCNKLQACNVTDVTDEQPFRFCPPGRPPIAIFRADGQFFATDDTCTHGEASLCEGFYENGVAECPFHAATFDVRTGEVLCSPATVALRTYPISVAAGYVYVDVDADVGA